MVTVGFTGETGAELMGADCDHLLAVPSRDTARIQECHEFVYHFIAGMVEKQLIERARGANGPELEQGIWPTVTRPTIVCIGLLPSLVAGLRFGEAACPPVGVVKALGARAPTDQEQRRGRQASLRAWAVTTYSVTDPAGRNHVGFHPQQAHYQLTRLAIALGPGNPIVRSLLRRRCAPHGVALEFPSAAVDIVKVDRVIRISRKNWLYAPTIAASFKSYFGQVVPTSSGTSLLVDYSGPRLQTYTSSGLEFEINSFPEEDSAIDDYFRWYRPKEGDVVFDLGAYCGVSTYFFSKSVGESGRVYSFEPDASSYTLLLHNIERHQLRNVTPLLLAVAATSGEEEFYQEGTLGRYCHGTVRGRPRVSRAGWRPSTSRRPVRGSGSQRSSRWTLRVLKSRSSRARGPSCRATRSTLHWIRTTGSMGSERPRR